MQRQLVERDLPAVVPALEKALGREITYAVYKGVGNYVCLQKMNSEIADPDGEVLLEISSLGKDANRLTAWAKTPGVSGDRDDAPEVDRRVWLANSLSGRECVGADVCAYGTQCFAAKAKAKAQTADVVITNHTLLAIEIVDSHPILPERDAVILDEAHEFMDRTTQAVTEELTSARVIRAAAMAGSGESSEMRRNAAHIIGLLDGARSHVGVVLTGHCDQISVRHGNLPADSFLACCIRGAAAIRLRWGR